MNWTSRADSTVQYGLSGHRFLQDVARGVAAVFDAQDWEETTLIFTNFLAVMRMTLTRELIPLSHLGRRPTFLEPGVDENGC